MTTVNDEDENADEKATVAGECVCPKCNRLFSKRELFAQQKSTAVCSCGTKLEEKQSLLTALIWMPGVAFVIAFLFLLGTLKSQFGTPPWPFSLSPPIAKVFFGLFTTMFVIAALFGICRGVFRLTHRYPLRLLGIQDFMFGTGFVAGFIVCSTLALLSLKDAISEDADNERRATIESRPASGVNTSKSVELQKNDDR